MVELAEAKAKVRRWRQELEEKCEQVAELRDELDALKTQSAKIKQENMDLVQVDPDQNQSKLTFFKLMASIIGSEAVESAAR